MSKENKVVYGDISRAHETIETSISGHVSSSGNFNAKVHQKTLNRFIEVQYKVPDPENPNILVFIRKKFHGLSAKTYDRACTQGQLQLLLLPQYGPQASSPRDMWYPGSRRCCEVTNAIIGFIIAVIVTIIYCDATGNAGAAILGIIAILLFDFALLYPLYWFVKHYYLWGGNVTGEEENIVGEEK